MAGGINALGNTLGKVDANNQLVVALGSGSTLPNDIDVDAGTGTADAGVGGVLSVNATPVGNVGSGEDNLMTYSLPANTLSSDGYAVRVKVWGSTAANANNKTIKLYFGSLAYNAGAVAANGQSWVGEMIIVRTSATAQRRFGTVLFNNGTGNGVTSSTLTETLANAVTIKVTGEATADNDVVQHGMIVEFLRAGA